MSRKGGKGRDKGIPAGKAPGRDSGQRLPHVPRRAGDTVRSCRSPETAPSPPQPPPQPSKMGSPLRGNPAAPGAPSQPRRGTLAPPPRRRSSRRGRGAPGEFREQEKPSPALGQRNPPSLPGLSRDGPGTDPGRALGSGGRRLNRPGTGTGPGRTQKGRKSPRK